MSEGNPASAQWTLADFDYDLPPGRIARHPVERRDASRLLAVDPATGRLRDLGFRDLSGLLSPGDLIVVNESRVIPARLLGTKPSGAEVEVLLVRPLDGDISSRRWEALVRPGRKLRPGRVAVIGEDLEVAILDSTPGGGRIVELHSDLPVPEALELYGTVPIPPYLERAATPSDRERYQTVYAAVPGSVAAPTAGLHFTGELFDEIAARGVRRASLTLHVGPGTFRPVDVEDPSDHVMHEEWYEVPESTALAVAETRSRGGRVWAVGTTVVRTLEAAADGRGAVQAGSSTTDLFIRPGHSFAVVDGLITNFHLPRSTLLMLVAALAGLDLTMKAYRHAVDQSYRFYSYGDAMAVLPS